MSQNPYAPPSAQVADQTVIQRGNYVPGGHGVPAGRGWDWITEAWGLFKASPGMWIAIYVTAFVIGLVAMFIPFIGGILLTLAMPVFAGGLMLGCRALEDGQELEFRHLFAGFQTNFGSLVAIGALYLAGSIAVMVVVVLLVGTSLLAIFGFGGSAAPQDAGAAMAALMTLAIAGLLWAALILPVVMAVWFAGNLVVLHDRGPIEAVKESFLGCVRNVVPFLVYGVIWLVLAFIATIPFGLGWLVLGPVTVASIYTAYRDIYLA